MSLYLNVPFDEKEEAKALGAKWNPGVKKWYVNCSHTDYYKYSHWLLSGRDSVIIAMDEIFVIEAEMRCWKCKKSTRVFGLGLRDFVRLFNYNNSPSNEISSDFISTHSLFRLAYTDKESNIPPALLNYIKENYNVFSKYSYAKKRVVFANHCEHCMSRLGNWYVYDRSDSPFSTSASNGRELKSRMECLKIKSIPILDDIPLFWKCSYTPNDYAYFEYADVENLSLTDNKDGIASYSDLFFPKDNNNFYGYRGK